MNYLSRIKEGLKKIEFTEWLLVISTLIAGLIPISVLWVVSVINSNLLITFSVVSWVISIIAIALKIQTRRELDRERIKFKEELENERTRQKESRDFIDNIIDYDRERVEKEISIIRTTLKEINDLLQKQR